MSSKGIYDNWSRNAKERNNKRVGIQRSNQNNVADDIAREKKKDSIVYNFDKDNFQNGKLWFNEGLSLDEAPDNLKDNISFISGFIKAEREQYVNDLAYQTGIEYRDKGILFDEIPEIYVKNEFFMEGYNSKKIKF